MLNKTKKRTIATTNNMIIEIKETKIKEQDSRKVIETVLVRKLYNAQSHLLIFEPNPQPQIFLSRVMFSVSCRCVMSCLITSPYFFGLLLPLVISTIFNLSDLLIRLCVHLLFTCSTRLRLTSLVLSTMKVIPTLFLISSFLFLSLFECPRIHFNIFISTICIF